MIRRHWATMAKGGVPVKGVEDIVVEGKSWNLTE
jgi:hypothetical protein